MTKDNLDVTEALLALAHFNIPPDVQELLVHGNPSREVPPGALEAAMQSAREPKVSSDVVEAITAWLYARAGGVSFDQLYPMEQEGWRRQAREVAALATLQPADPIEPKGGFAYFNEDTGMEWSRNHPVESGEVPDATEIEAMTLGEFRHRWPADPVEPKVIAPLPCKCGWEWSASGYPSPNDVCHHTAGSLDTREYVVTCPRCRESGPLKATAPWAVQAWNEQRAPVEPKVSSDVVAEVARAIEAASCPGREGPFGGYDYGYNHEDSLPEGGRYVVRDFRDPASPTWGAWVHQTADRDLHEAEFKRLTEHHIAKAAIATLRASDPQRDALVEALQKLERASTKVNTLGAQCGRQWGELAGALISARTALAQGQSDTKGEGHE